MRTFAALLMALGLSFGTLGMIGCERDAGDRVDDVIDRTQDSADDVADEIEDAVD